MSKIFILFLISVIVNSCYLMPVNYSMDKIDKILYNEIKNQRTPSVQYFIFKNDIIIYKYQSGLADIKNKKLVSDRTTYNVFSITKTFTAMAVLQLVQQNKIDINRTVIKYLPEFPYSSEITVKHLLTHSSGLPNPIPLRWIHLLSEHEIFNKEEFFSRIINKNSEVKSEPNEEYRYSNLGYFFLGQLIEKIAGNTYENYVNENIIRILGLLPEEIGFTNSDTSIHAKGYIKNLSFENFIMGFLIDKTKFMDNLEGKWKPFRIFYVNGASYGGLITTPVALVKYIQELLKPNCSLINDEYRKMLFTENYANNGEETGMCLSWFRGELKGRQYFTHAGGGGGYYSEIRIYPEIGIGSVIMFNRTGISDERFLDKVDKYFIHECAEN